MKSKLESYITENKEAFNTHEPTSSLWGSVQSNIPASTVVRQVKWLKTIGVGLGTTIVGISSYVLMKDQSPSAQPKSIVQSEVVVESTREELSIEEKVVEDDDLRIESASDFHEKSDNYVIEMTALDFNTLERNSFLASYKVPIPSEVGFRPLEYSKTLNKAPSKISINALSVLTDTLFTGVKKVVLNSGFMNLKVTQNKQAHVAFNSEVFSVRQEQELNAAGFSFNFERFGDVLTITTCLKSKKRCKLHCDNEENALITLQVPEKTDLELRSTTGHIEVSNLSNEKLKINSSLGDIFINDVRSTFDVHNTMGDIELNQLKGDAKVISSSGDVDVKNVDGAYEIRATLGDLQIQNLKGALQAYSTSGDINLNTIESEDMVSIYSTLGSVDAEQLVCPLKVTSTGGNLYINHLKGDFILKSSLGNQKLSHVTGNGALNSTSGDIRLFEVQGNVKVKTSLGDVKYEASNGSGIIETNSGDVRLKDLTLQDNLTVNCTLGNIEIELNNASNEIAYAINSNQGNIDVYAGSERLKGSKELTAGSGNILIQLTTTSGNVLLKSN